MKKALMVLAVCLVAMTYVKTPVEESIINVKAEQGSTIWEICEEHYDKNEVRCFEEFVYDVRKDNDLLGNKMLQAGQIVKVVVKTQK